MNCGYCGKFCSYDKRKTTTQVGQCYYKGYYTYIVHKKCHTKFKKELK